MAWTLNQKIKAEVKILKAHTKLCELKVWTSLIVLVIYPIQMSYLFIYSWDMVQCVSGVVHTYVRTMELIINQ